MHPLIALRWRCDGDGNPVNIVPAGPAPVRTKTVREVQLLWTGGWDSTFRLLQALLVERRPVQPIYLVNPARSSVLHELRAMEAVRDGVRARLAEPGLLRPTTVHVRDQFPPGPHLRALHEQVAAVTRIGTQYVWLAAAAEALGWHDVELSVERYPDAPGLTPFLRGARDGDLPGAALFRAFSFPVLHLTKAEMRETARAHGFLDLLLLRWFCHDPLGRRPCGRCRPCRLAVWDGVRPAPAPLVQARRVARRLVR